MVIRAVRRDSLKDPVEGYLEKLREYATSDNRIFAIVEKIRQFWSPSEAVEFFKKTHIAPNTLRWVFYDENAKRKALIRYQEYLREIGMKVPVPIKLVQGFLDGGKYPVKKK